MSRAVLFCQPHQQLFTDSLETKTKQTKNKKQNFKLDCQLRVSRAYRFLRSSLLSLEHNLVDVLVDAFFRRLYASAVATL